MSVKDIYAIEEACEGGLAGYLNDNLPDLKYATTLTAPQFQSDRPRVEIMCVLGAGQGRWKSVEGITRETSWDAQYLLALITNDDIAIHTSYRSTLRATMHQITGLNETYLPLHKIQPFFLDGGTSPVVKPQEGDMVSRMVFNIKVSVQDNAWAQLNN